MLYLNVNTSKFNIKLTTFNWVITISVVYTISQQYMWKDKANKTQRAKQRQICFSSEMPLSATNEELYCQIQFQFMKCKKFLSTMRIQLMAQLEQDEERPFEATGILDLNGKTTKCKLLCTICAYVFICLKYKN